MTLTASVIIAWLLIGLVIGGWPGSSYRADSTSGWH